MGGGMPYQLEKGPYFSITEAVLEDVDDRIALLVDLRNEKLVDDMPTLDAPSLNEGPTTEPERFEHQNVDWYGKRGVRKADGTIDWLDQLPFNIATNPTTGYWYRWYGDAYAIVREAFTRAIEVSLGIPHDEQQKDAAAIKQQKKQEWPIEVFWRCPAPWFESWITWRGDKLSSTPSTTGAQRNGHVTVHIHTPSHKGSALLLGPIRATRTAPARAMDSGPYPPAPAPARPLDPAPYSSRGMWVVAQPTQNEHLYDFAPPEQTGKGMWQYPAIGPLVESQGDPVVVQPNEPDGGVLPTGDSTSSGGDEDARTRSVAASNRGRRGRRAGRARRVGLHPDDSGGREGITFNGERNAIGFGPPFEKFEELASDTR